MVGWHHQLNGHEFEQPLGDHEGKGSHGVAVHDKTTTNENLLYSTGNSTQGSVVT